MEKNQQNKKTAPNTAKNKDAGKKAENPYEKDFETCQKLLSNISGYPVLTSREEFEQSFSKLQKIYMKKGDVVKHMVLYSLFRMIVRSNEFRMSRDAQYYARARFNGDMQAAKRETIRSILAAEHSIETIAQIIEQISTWNDVRIIKLLNSCLSHFLCRDMFEGTKMLKNAVINALGDAQHPYALQSLLTYAKLVNEGETAMMIRKNLEKWSKKMTKTQQKEYGEEVEKYLSAKPGLKNQYL